MPWKVFSMSAQRLTLVHQVVTCHRPLSVVAREFGVSRKTAYKWLQRHRLSPEDPLLDRCRRPRRMPGRTVDAIEREVLEIRRRYNWGPRERRATDRMD